MDFGLGIGYNPESGNPSSQTVPSRAAAVSSLRTGMMAQFKSNFVAATTLSSSQNQGSSKSSSVYANKRPVLQGFVSGGTIGGDTNRAQTTNSFIPAHAPAPMSVEKTSDQNSGQNVSHRNSER